MKLLLEVNDNKAPYLLKILKELDFVKITSIPSSNSLLVAQIQEAVDEIKMIKAGKKKARNAEAFLNEL